MRISLLNVPHELRIHNLGLVAYLPILRRPPSITVEDWRVVKLTFLNKCMDKVLAPLKQASKDGVKVRLCA